MLLRVGWEHVMRIAWGGVISAFVIFVSAPVGAQMSEAARRQILVPVIRAASSCIAREALEDPGLVSAYLEGHFAAFLLGAPARRCAEHLEYMIAEHDRLYGYGSGQVFFRGAYADDLPRAVLSRINPDLQRKIAQRERDEVERKSAAERAEAARRAEIARQEAERQRAESERRAAEVRAEQERRRAAEEAQRAFDLIKDRLYACAEKRLEELTRSGEPATVLANATMTICSAEVADAVDAGVQVLRAKAKGAVGETEEDAMRESIRSGLRDRVVAMAVQVKARVSQ